MINRNLSVMNIMNYYTQEKGNKPLNKAIGYVVLCVCFCFTCLTTRATTNITVQPYEIKFNYDNSGFGSDALTIRDATGGAQNAPEWAYNSGNPISEKFAYIMGQSNRSIHVRFNSNCTDMHLIINLTVTSGTGVGTVCNYFVANYTALDWITLQLSGNIPGSVGDRKSVV